MTTTDKMIDDEIGHLRKTLVRSNATCDDDDTNLRSTDQPVRLVSSQTKPALSSSASKDSTCFTDATDTDLHSFIVKTLHKNEKDRKLILRTEETLIKLLNDEHRQSVTFEEMTSYERMIVHRVAAWFGLDHNVSQSGKNIVASKTDKAKIPERDFKSLIIAGKPYTDVETGRSTLKSRSSFGSTPTSCSMAAMTAGSSRQRGNQNMYYTWQPFPMVFNPPQQPLCSLMQIPSNQSGKYETYQAMPQIPWFPGANVYSGYQNNMTFQPQCSTTTGYSSLNCSYPYDVQSQQLNNFTAKMDSNVSFVTQPSTRNY
ncbi:R3H domain-containing protein [Aphelenchoides besseyi]|nr:R3H domain-containing protein [Aphelenchoides besseyi]